MLGWRTGERKNFLSEAKQQNMPKILTVGARDQERLIGSYRWRRQMEQLVEALL